MKWPKEAVYEDHTHRFYKRALTPRQKCCSCNAFFGRNVCATDKKKKSSALKSYKVKPHEFVVASAQIGHLTFVNNWLGSVRM